MKLFNLFPGNGNENSCWNYTQRSDCTKKLKASFSTLSHDQNHARPWFLKTSKPEAMLAKLAEKLDVMVDEDYRWVLAKL